MNTFKRKSLYAALAGVSALGVTGAAQAVNLNPDGLGQVLIYPYYTTRADAGGNAYSSLLSVVNTTSSAKAVKVRFLEGKNSREVLDFNLFLSKHDVWTAAILPSRRPAGAACRHARPVVHAAPDSLDRPEFRELCVHRVRTDDKGRRESRPDEGRLRRNHRDGDVRHRFDDVADRHARQWRPRAKQLHLRRPDRFASGKRRDHRAGRHLRRHDVDQRQCWHRLHRRRGRAGQLRPVRRSTSTTPPGRSSRICRGDSRRSARFWRAARSTRRAGSSGTRRSGQRRADAFERDERVRAGFGHQVRHRLGRNVPDQALLRQRRALAMRRSCSSATSTRPTAPATTCR